MANGEGHKNATGPTVEFERVRQFLETPEIATPWEVSRIAQHLLDVLTVCGLNDGTIRAQQTHIEQLEAKLAAVGPKKHLRAPATAHDVELEAHGVDS